MKFTSPFIEFIFVETNQLFTWNSNVILTRQTSGHRSSMAAGSKRRALAFYFSMRIWYMFLTSKCRVEWDLGLCSCPVLAKRMQLRCADFRLKNVLGCKIREKPSWHCARSEIWALGVCFPKPCSRFDRTFAAPRSRSNYCRPTRIGLFPQKRSRWNDMWTEAVLRAYSGGFNDVENYDQDKYGFKWQTELLWNC